jgi:hypothetical protein
MAVKKFEIEVDLPDGWEAVEYRVPQFGEFFLGTASHPVTACDMSTPWLIVRRAKQYREPVLPADAEKVVEVRSDELATWEEATLVGYRHHDPLPWNVRADSSKPFLYKFCRIEVEAAQ